MLVTARMEERADELTGQQARSPEGLWMGVALMGGSSQVGIKKCALSSLTPNAQCLRKALIHLSYWVLNMRVLPLKLRPRTEGDHQS